MSDWREVKKAQALSNAAIIDDVIKDYEGVDSIGNDANARHRLAISFASERGSFHWRTFHLPWGALRDMLNPRIEIASKDSWMLLPGTLAGGETHEGARRLKDNVQGLDCVVLDFDKGDAPLDVLEARLQGLGIEGAAFATYSNNKAKSKLSWSVARPNTKTGVIEVRPGAFQLFVREVLALGDSEPVHPDAVTAELAKRVLIERQGYNEAVLGTVTIDQDWAVETLREKRKDGTQIEIEQHLVVVNHAPLAKSRLVIPLARPFCRQPEESPAQFQLRWKQEVYEPIGKLVGLNFDSACSSTERGHYAMTRKAGTEFIPVRVVNGRLIDTADPEVAALVSKEITPQTPQTPQTPKAQKPKPPRRSATSAKPEQREHSPADSKASDGDWHGFMAADAAADLLESVTDKRDTEKPLVAFPCPFVHEHATTNDPTSHQCYAFNASSPTKLPVVKCQAATCSERPYVEFLDEMFADAKSDPKYQTREMEADQSGVSVHRDDLGKILKLINESWAVVRVGGKVRYLHQSHEGDVELYDAASAAGWFANWEYCWEEDRKPQSAPIFPRWQKWKYRRQFLGIRFCPEPSGAPDGYFNTYAGMTVKPQRGGWNKLKAHIYRNICQRNPEYFRFFIAWLAQLVQEPHIKPGTNIVLKGGEGVGKSKVGEWVVKLLGRNATTVAEAERITGRFNSHLENKLFLMAEEAFWAGDKAAEGKLKDLATGTNMSYERKGLDPYDGKNYTRIMIASNEDWVVPASSGGRRWFVLEVGNEHQKDFAYFAAIDQEMANGGLPAMLHDLLNTPLPMQVNVRSAPITPWLVEQRLHSYDNKYRWLRSVIADGGFWDNTYGTFVGLNEAEPTAVSRDIVYASARQYFRGPKGVDPSSSEVGQFIRKIFGDLSESRPRHDGQRKWHTVFPSLTEMRTRWMKVTGEVIAPHRDDGDNKQILMRNSTFSDNNVVRPRPTALLGNYRSYAVSDDAANVNH